MKIRKYIGKKLTSKVSPLAMFIGCLVVCVIIAGSVVKANNDNITVQNGGVLNITNQAQDAGNLGYSVNFTNDSDVDASFSNDVDVVGDLTAGTITSDAGISGTTATFTGELQGSTIISGGLVKNVDLGDGTTDLLTASEICDYARINYYTNGANATITVASTTALLADCLNTNGDSKFLVIENKSYDATTTTIATNTDGTDIIKLLQGGVDGAIASTSRLILQFFRASSTQIEFNVVETVKS
jgi:hypothetical protein